MSSLKYGRDIALISHSQGIITGEELIFLLEENTLRKPEFSYDVYGTLTYKKWKNPNANLNSESRSTIFLSLLMLLAYQRPFKCPQRSVAGGIEGLCMLLK